MKTSKLKKAKTEIARLIKEAKGVNEAWNPLQSKEKNKPDAEKVLNHQLATRIDNKIEWMDLMTGIFNMGDENSPHFVRKISGYNDAAKKMWLAQTTRSVGKESPSEPGRDVDARKSNQKAARDTAKLQNVAKRKELGVSKKDFYGYEEGIK